MLVTPRPGSVAYVRPAGRFPPHRVDIAQLLK